jgi:hypothetical protein
MKMRTILLAPLALLVCGFAAPLAAQDAASAAPDTSVTAEYYYRIKWGSADEFKRLYERNHAPILREMMKQGFITRMKMEEPFTHLAGAPRWDLRVTITFRDAASAVGVGGAYDEAANKVTTRLYPDEATFKTEEAKRFSLLEEHWDVIVVAAGK